jgi:V/A-type H+-transporting ATPase subunit I
MAIVKLKKLTVCGLKPEKIEVLKKLQILGGAHLIPLNKLEISTKTTPQKQIERAVHALKYLTQCTKRRHQVNEKENFNLDNIVSQVLNIKIDLRKLCDQRDFLINRIAEINPWGDFTLEKGDIKGIKLWFYIIPKRLMKLLHDELIFQVVHEDNIHCYVVVLAEQEPSVASVPVPRTHTGKVPLSKLNNDLQWIELALEDKQAERESLTRWIALIVLSLAENEDNAN